MTNQRLRILHLSDLHIGKEKPENAYRVERVMGDAWDRNLIEIRKDGQIDLVCFTGDLAQSGRADQYHRLKDVIRNVQARVDSPLQRFFSVPGDHDIDRAIEKKRVAQAPSGARERTARIRRLVRGESAADSGHCTPQKTEVACRRVSRTSRAARCWPGSRRIAIFSSKRGWRIRSPHRWADLIRTWAIAKPFPRGLTLIAIELRGKCAVASCAGADPGMVRERYRSSMWCEFWTPATGVTPFVASTISALTPGAVDASRFQSDRECGAIQNVL